MSRKDYQKLIEENLRPKIGDNYRYEKSIVKMYFLLKEHGSVNNAIRNAKRRVENDEGRQDHANHNPCTLVWKLVEESVELQYR